MSDLSNDKFGRFGNQLFKFFFLKIVEKEIGCEIRYPNWLGNVAFNLPASPELLYCEDALIIHPAANHSLKDVLNIIREKISSGSQAIDINGFFQFHTNEYENYKNIFHETFNFQPILLNQIANAIENSQLNNCDLISIHIRRGDYTSHTDSEFFWTTPMQSIFDSIKNIETTKFKKSALYVCSDDINYCASEFRDKNIAFFSADSLFTYNDDSLRLLVDFYLMTISKVNIISNSSLSFFCSMLNTKSRIFLRPSPINETLLPFDPWNSDVLLARKKS